MLNYGIMLNILKSTPPVFSKIEMKMYSKMKSLVLFRKCNALSGQT